MQLFVGLGNPGAKYAHNRHNIGFMAVDAIAAAHGFGPWRNKFQAAVAEGRLGGDKILLIKPQTFMNLSGQAVGEAMRYLKLTPADIWVFHDELDLAPGKVRVKTGGGHAGHNGLRSMHQHVGAEFNRIRLGIGHPGHKHMVSHYVLHDFAEADREWLDPLLAAVGREASRLAAGDAAGFMNAVAMAARPVAPKSKSPAATANSDSAGPPAEGKPETGKPSALDRLVAMFSRK
jgi:PTH1 family peptidyl-tRNA hydrolase